jgi:predicted ATPase
VPSRRGGQCWRRRAGAGGCGKTRLALQATADGLARYLDGVWLVELAPLADESLVPQAVAAVVGVREEPGRPLVATLTDALKPRRLLLVLDNCASTCWRPAPGWPTPCCAPAPTCASCAPAGRRWGIAGEAASQVPSLALPDPERLPPVAALTQVEAVRLFLDRTVAVQPSFRLTSTNATAVGQICWRLDGIPWRWSWRRRASGCSPWSSSWPGWRTASAS